MHHRPVIPTNRNDLEIVVTDDGSRTIRLKGTETTWHSESGALAESELVFLENSRAKDRLQHGVPTRILEIGLGTGLNFWITASLAYQYQTPLTYVSIEPSLMSLDLIELLEHGQLASCQPGYDRFCNSMFKQRSDRLQVESVRFERIDNLGLLSIDSVEPFDAVYHDPFSPEVAPELWSTEVFAKLKLLLNPSGRLVTYCVKSSIQRALKSTGFRIEKTRGPVGGKREVLIAINELG